MRTDINSGAMYTLRDMERETGLADGTYVAALSAELVTDSGAYHYWAPALRLTAVTERSGYEVAYDAITPESHGPTQGGPQAYLQEGDRIGIWTGPDGVRYIDRTIHVQAPRDIALAIGETFQQSAVWDWAAAESVTVGA
jgi:hypothetical protein